MNLIFERISATTLQKIPNVGTGGQSTTLTIFSGKMGKRSKYVIAKNGTSALLNVVSYKIDELWHLKLSPILKASQR